MKKDETVAAKLAVGNGSHEDLDRERLEFDALNNEQFRHRFLERNRPWILENLVDLIPSEELPTSGPNGRPLVEYIRNLLSTLVSMGEGARGSGDRPDISSDEGDDDDLENRKGWDRNPLFGSNFKIAKLWLNRARKMRKFRAVVEAIKNKRRKQVCTSCTRPERSCSFLRVFLSTEGRPDPYSLENIMKSFEEEYGKEENDTILWKSFFQTKAKYVTLCNFCIDRNHSNGGDTNPGSTYITRPDDISSDESEEEEECLFDPLVILNTSIEGRMLQKWLGIARKKLGGDFPRPGSKEEIELYLKHLKKQKIQERKSGINIMYKHTHDFIKVKSNDDGTEQFEPVQLSEKATFIISNWLKSAQLRSVKRFEERGDEVRNQLRRILDKMNAVDDWFFGREMRLNGLNLKEQGYKLREEAKEKEKELNKKIEQNNNSAKYFIADIENTIERKRIEMQKLLSDSLFKSQIDMEMRSRELSRALDELKRRHSEEKVHARESEGAVSSSIISRQNEEVIRLQTVMSEELVTSKKKWDLKTNEIQRQFEREEIALIRSKRERVRDDRSTIKTLEMKFRSEIHPKETEWRSEASQWILWAERKLDKLESEYRVSSIKAKKRKKRLM